MNLCNSGSNRTEEIARQLGRPCLWINKVFEYGDFVVQPPVPSLVWWLDKHKIRILNVAGNRESVLPGIRDKVCQYLIDNLG